MIIKWFARGGGIEKAGPYDNQVLATNAMRQVAETDEEYKRAVWNGVIRKQLKGYFPADVFVWPEEVEEQNE